MPKFEAIRDGDSIVVRMTLDAITQLLAAGGPELGGVVNVTDGDELLDEIVDNINRVDAIEPMLAAELADMLDGGSPAMQLIPAPVREPAPSSAAVVHPRNMAENAVAIARAQLRAEGHDLPGPTLM